MDVPGSLDLRQHDHVELCADRADDLDHVVEHPRRIERIDPRPQTGCAEIVCLGQRDDARPAALASAGIASSRLPSTTSTCAIRSGTFARSFSICGGTKWIIRSSFTGSSRSGAGAPMASGWKKFRGSFTSWSWSMPSDLL